MRIRDEDVQALHELHQKLEETDEELRNAPLYPPQKRWTGCCVPSERPVGVLRTDWRRCDARSRLRLTARGARRSRSGVVVGGEPRAGTSRWQYVDWRGPHTGPTEVHGAAGVMVGSMDQSGLPA